MSEIKLAAGERRESAERIINRYRYTILVVLLAIILYLARDIGAHGKDNRIKFSSLSYF
jgi:Na+/H+ antiporter NhaC